jgi:hypothetical protein
MRFGRKNKLVSDFIIVAYGHSARDARSFPCRDPGGFSGRLRAINRRYNRKSSAQFEISEQFA